MTGLASQRGVGRWGLQPFFNNELASLIAEGEASGHHIGVTEGFRSYAAQVAAARNKPGLAARPGHSRHGLGLAADLHGDLAWAHIHAAAHWAPFSDVARPPRRQASALAHRANGRPPTPELCAATAQQHYGCSSFASKSRRPRARQRGRAPYRQEAPIRARACGSRWKAGNAARKFSIEHGLR